MHKDKKWGDRLWDFWCIASIIGIWPRFIEPNTLTTTSITLPIPNLPGCIKGLKILHFSDLHWNERFSLAFSRRLSSKIKSLKPDLICFTGDFICRSNLEQKETLKHFLQGLQAPLGVFAVLGNHDYSAFVTVNTEGDYAVEQPNPSSNILKGFQRLFEPILPPSGKITDSVKNLTLHHDLMALLEKTSIRILNNETMQIPIGDSFLNVCGLGEFSLGQTLPQKAFTSYQEAYPGIVLSHNPDSIPLLIDYPGDLILSGHTHGGQINLPWIGNKLTKMQYPEYKRGLKKLKNKMAYINRGIGGVVPFRWFSLPEITLITLQPSSFF